MKAFSCPTCANVVYFENTKCERCENLLGYIPELNIMSSVVPEGPVWRSVAEPLGSYRFCTNWEQQACNWLVNLHDSAGVELCEACQHNRSIPDLSNPHYRLYWQRIENAKRRLFYSLIKLGLPRPTALSGAKEPLIFDFLADGQSTSKVMTGHDEGTITIALNEADDAHREEMRGTLKERYRTLLGHFRHEVGHYYWDRLVRDRDLLNAFRDVYGDERADYEAALQTYYKSGAPPDWQARAISAYATSHPWEDFAETWSHYLHIVDTLEMAYSFGLSIAPRDTGASLLPAALHSNPYDVDDGAALVRAWQPISIAVNNLNRTMGLPDLYPFVISPAVVSKLDFIIQIIQNHSR